MQSDQHLLADLVDPARLQRMCDGLSAAAGVGLAVLDPAGAVLVAAGWQDICTRFHRLHEETLKGCLESDVVINRLLAESVEAPTHHAYKCANGLWDVAFPLIVDGRHLANVFTGQFFYDDDLIDEAAFRARARRLGFDETTYLEALARVPVLSHERVAQTIGFLGDFVGMLAETGLSALRQEQERDALRESEERYRQLFEAESDAVFLIDNETGRILEANGAASAVYGYSRDELLALTNEDLSAEPEKTQAVTHGTPLVTDNVVTIPLRIHRKKDGSTFPVEITGRFFTRQGRAVHVAAVRDISGRRLTEDALRQSEDRFSKAFLGSPDAIIITRARDGRLVEVNEAFTRLAGYSKEEALTGTTVALDLWARPGDRERCIAALESGSRVNDMEFDFRVKSGEVVACLYSGALIDVNGEYHVLSIVRDVTDQRRMEADVKRSEALLRGILDNVQDAYVRTDLQGRLFMASPSAARLYGFESTDEMIGLAAESLYADLAERETMFEELRKTGHVVDYVGRGLTKDGRIIRVSLNAQFFRDEAGNVAGTEGFIRDISERKQAEEELQQSRALFQAAMDQSQAGIAIADAPDGRLRYVNQAGLFIRGGSSAELIDHVDAARYVASWQILHHDGTPYAADDVPLTRAVLYGETSEAEFIIRRDDHDDRLVSARAAPIRDADGLVTAGVVVFDDITERKRIEEEIRHLNAELEQRVLSRTTELEAANAELESFAYSVSHDLRAPLRALDGFSQILLDDYGAQLDDEGRALLERIRAADKRMGALIDALLDLSRLSRGEPSRERLDVSALARSAAAELAEAEPERAVEFVIAEGLEAEADRRLVQALLANLLGNAWKFTAKHETARIEVGVEEVGGERAFFVRDDGAGFDMAYADKLFGAFQRLHSPGEFEGLGIGLATAQRIVRRHGGRVWGAGEVEKGATFWFTLPPAPRT